MNATEPSTEFGITSTSASAKRASVLSTTTAPMLCAGTVGSDQYRTAAQTRAPRVTDARYLVRKVISVERTTPNPSLSRDASPARKTTDAELVKGVEHFASPPLL